MKVYIKTYLNYMEKHHNLLPHELLCEIPGCGARVVDIHHIEGKGTHPELINEITNLVGLCRNCHEKYGQRKQYVEFLKSLKK